MIMNVRNVNMDMDLMKQIEINVLMSKKHSKVITQRIILVIILVLLKI